MLYKNAWPIVLLTAIAIIFVLLAVQKNSWLKALENFAKKILPSRFAHLAEFLIETIMAFRSCYEPKILLYGIFLGVLALGSRRLRLLVSDAFRFCRAHSRHNVVLSEPHGRQNTDGESNGVTSV